MSIDGRAREFLYGIESTSADDVCILHEEPITGLGVASQDVRVHQSPDFEGLFHADGMIGEAGAGKAAMQYAGGGDMWGPENANHVSVRSVPTPEVKEIAETRVLQAERTL